MRTHSSTAEVVGAIAPSLPETYEPRTLKARAQALNGVFLDTPKAVSPPKALPGSMVSNCDAMRQSSSANIEGPGVKAAMTLCTGTTKSSRTFGLSPVEAVLRGTAWRNRPSRAGGPSRVPSQRCQGSGGTITPGNDVPDSVLDVPDKALNVHTCVPREPAPHYHTCYCCITDTQVHSFLNKAPQSPNKYTVQVVQLQFRFGGARGCITPPTIVTPPRKYWRGTYFSVLPWKNC